MYRKVFQRIACIMLGIALAFIAYALNHPEFSFPWSNGITYTIYAIYLGIMVLLFLLSRR